MATDDLDEIRALMRRKRADHAAQVERLDAALRLLDDQLAESSTSLAEHRATPSSGSDRPTRSVRVKVLDLLCEADRDWSVADIVREYERRGDPIASSKPPSAVRTAFAKLYADKDVVRTSQGRYTAKRWAPDGLLPPVHHSPPSSNGVESSTHGEMVG